ncbi:MAG: hypothetical protein ACHQWU_12195 [Gemmatimonadales bacterium]
MSRRKPKKAATPGVPGEIDALAELEPFSKALASMAMREEPTLHGARLELVEATYIVRAAWLALHRRDADALHEMAKRARLYLDGAETHGIETIVCKMFPLPSIKGGNRSDRVRELLDFAAMALRGRRDADGNPIRATATEIAGWMDFAIERTFPELRTSWKGDDSKKIAAGIGDDFKTARDIVTRTLRAFDVSEIEIKSWVKSAEQRPEGKIRSK